MMGDYYVFVFHIHVCDTIQFIDLHACNLQYIGYIIKSWYAYLELYLSLSWVSDS